MPQCHFIPTTFETLAASCGDHRQVGDQHASSSLWVSITKAIIGLGLILLGGFILHQWERWGRTAGRATATRHQQTLQLLRIHGGRQGFKGKELHAYWTPCWWRRLEWGGGKHGIGRERDYQSALGQVDHVHPFFFRCEWCEPDICFVVLVRTIKILWIVVRD